MSAADTRPCSARREMRSVPRRSAIEVSIEVTDLFLRLITRDRRVLGKRSLQESGAALWGTDDQIVRQDIQPRGPPPPRGPDGLSPTRAKPVHVATRLILRSIA